MTTAEMPRTIRASIHPDALTRVPDFFNATLLQILNELFQNSRRANATRIGVASTHDQMAITDDGDGIADPAALLAFGLSGWDQDLARSEHPAGMGMYSLARRRGVSVTSRVRGSEAWTVDLEPGTFVGDAPAEVRPAPDFEPRHGTRITFGLDAKDGTPKHTTASAALFHPLPVHLNGSQLPSTDFLENADYVETWRGIRIGVYRHSPKFQMNFHGTVIARPNLPSLHCRRTSWNVQADVVDCPELQLVLPTRHQLVQTPFIDEFNTACRAAIYRAMIASGNPINVSFRLHADAGSLGIDLPEPEPTLARWTPAVARSGATRSTGTPETLPADPIVITTTMPPSEQQMLARAASQAGIIHRLFQAEPAMGGFAWYDSLNYAHTITFSYTANAIFADMQPLRELLEEDENNINLCPERIDAAMVNLKIRDQRGNLTTMGLATDILLIRDYEEQPDLNVAMATKNTSINPADLADMIVDAYFSPSDDKDADSFETQLQCHYAESLNLAECLLVSPEEAQRTAITNAVYRHIVFMLPPDTTLTVRTVRGSHAEVTLVQVPQPEPDPQENPEDPEKLPF